MQIVQYGTNNKINDVFQKNITLNRGPLNQTPLNIMTKENRKTVLETINRGLDVEITTQNGPLSNVASRRFAGNYPTVTDITISY